MCWNGWDLRKNNAVKSVKIHTFKISHHYISSWLNVCLDSGSKFQVAMTMMFDGWGNHEQTHTFGWVSTVVLMCLKS